MLLSTSNHTYTLVASFYPSPPGPTTAAVFHTVAVSDCCKPLDSYVTILLVYVQLHSSCQFFFSGEHSADFQELHSLVIGDL